MRLHTLHARDENLAFSVYTLARLTRLFMNAFRRLIKRARNCEHASNVAREPDDRDIGTSFYAAPIIARERADEREEGDSPVGNLRRKPRQG